MSPFPESDDRAARAFERVGYDKLADKLYVYATYTMRLASIGARRAGEVEALDLVGTLCMKVLEGRIVWALPEDASEEEIVGYACRKMYGMLSTLRRRGARTSGGDAVDDLADDAPDAFSMLLTQRGIADLTRALDGDGEASAYLQGMLGGDKRAEIAAALGCTVEHADVVHKRIMRCAAALHERDEDTCEDEPPSSGPRGHDDELPTAQERHRAPPEPPRRALRAAGRRR
jgi:hypothetical protein